MQGGLGPKHIAQSRQQARISYILGGASSGTAFLWVWRHGGFSVHGREAASLNRQQGGVAAMTDPVTLILAGLILFVLLAGGTR